MSQTLVKSLHFAARKRTFIRKKTSLLDKNIDLIPCHTEVFQQVTTAFALCYCQTSVSDRSRKVPAWVTFIVLKSLVYCKRKDCVMSNNTAVFSAES